MAEVIGFLRENPTHGGKGTLKLLSRNLPRVFAVYVRSPIPEKQDLHYLAMSRAREKRYMTCFRKLPRPYECLPGQNLADFVG